MATALSRDPRAVDALLAAVKQLPSAELREFQRQFIAWSGQINQPNGDSWPEKDEEALLAAIRENSTLPATEQRDLNRLRRKRQAGQLSGTEETQLQALWCRVEQMSAARLEALAELARRRGTDVRKLMRELGLPENYNVF